MFATLRYQVTVTRLDTQRVTTLTVGERALQTMRPSIAKARERGTCHVSIIPLGEDI